jgi:hypothetical protein
MTEMAKTKRKTAAKPKEKQGPDLPYQKTSERKDRGAITLCVTPARRLGRNRTICAGFYYAFVIAEHRNVRFITIEGR